ncbi:MAG: hypothetical protein N3F63_07650 [Thermoplasmata archaeon]|nr:hypothetical protein [Thermoplasmata archaeon]
MEEIKPGDKEQPENGNGGNGQIAEGSAAPVPDGGNPGSGTQEPGQPVDLAEKKEPDREERGGEREKLTEVIARIENGEKKLAEIEARIEQIQEEMKSFRTLVATVNNLSETIKSAGEYASNMLDTAFKDKFSNTAREIEKLNEKITMLVDEVGAGEGLNVGKIPPTILEIVYQSTLDDVVNAIFRHLGYAEAERRIAETLEEIRERTSGSELFRFDGKRIRARDVAKSIEKKLVSARQMQTTYDELLRKLLELVPGYKPKNFRAMIKLKSQEYSVDSTIHLTERVSELEKWMAKMEGLLGEADQREVSVLESLNELTGRIEELRRMMSEGNAALRATLEEYNARLANLEAEMESTRGEARTGIEGVLRRIQVIEERLGIVPEPVEKPEEIKPEVCGEKQETGEISGDESFLYYAVENERSLTDLKSTLSLMFSDEKIEALIENLLKKGCIEKFEKAGEIYLRRVERKEETVEPSLEEKILQAMEDGFTFRKLQHRFKDVDKAALQAALEKLIDEGKIYVEGTERRKIYRIPSPSIEEKKDGGV